MKVGVSEAVDAATIAHELRSQLGPEAPAALVLFSSPQRPGSEVVRLLAAAWPATAIVGCTSAGEMATGSSRMGSVVAAGLNSSIVRRVSAVGADYEAGVEAGLASAVEQLETEFGPLRELDPERHLGLIFIDSTHGVEEQTLALLGNAAPLLSFVGGSAGDDLAFVSTTAFAGAGDALRTTTHGAAFLLMELSCPFRVSKTCHFGATETTMEVTKADGRVLHELDGRPAAEVYAEHVDLPPSELSSDNLFGHPLGLVIDGEPWIRQAVPPIAQDGSIFLGCAIAPGSRVAFLPRRQTLLENLREELDAARAELGSIRGALLFDCVLRRLELEATDTKEAYAQMLDFPVAGFHTHGESWLGHMHQTLTGVFFGAG